MVRSLAAPWDSKTYDTSLERSDYWLLSGCTVRGVAVLLRSATPPQSTPTLLHISAIVRNQNFIAVYKLAKYTVYENESEPFVHFTLNKLVFFKREWQSLNGLQCPWPSSSIQQDIRSFMLVPQGAPKLQIIKLWTIIFFTISFTYQKFFDDW